MITPASHRALPWRMAFPFLGLALAVTSALAAGETVVPAQRSWRISSSSDDPPPAEILKVGTLHVGTHESRTSVALLQFDLPDGVELDPQQTVTLELEVESSMDWGGVWVNMYDAASDPEARPLDGEAPDEVPVGVIVPAPTLENPRGPMSGKVSLQLSYDAVDRLRSERKLVLVLHGSSPIYTGTVYRIFSESSDSPPVLRIAGGG